MVYDLGWVWQGFAFTLQFKNVFFFYDVWVHIYLFWILILFVVGTLIWWTLGLINLEGIGYEIWLSWYKKLLWLESSLLEISGLDWVECRKVLECKKK